MSKRKKQQQPGHLSLNPSAAREPNVMHRDELAQVMAAVPDMRERLTYVLSMTEQAVSRVLNAIDVVMPLLEKRQGEAQALLAQWAQVVDKRRDSRAYRQTLQATHDYLQSNVQDSQIHKGHLMEIVMAQEFQDLTGQVIKRMVDLTQQIEKALLVCGPPTQQAVGGGKKTNSLLNGPVMPSDRLTQQVFTSQADIDQFLDDQGL